MKELWTVIGLAVLDGNFREDLRKAIATGELADLGNEVQEYGYSLSIYELADLQRILSVDFTKLPPPPLFTNILDLFEYALSGGWVPEDDCCWIWWKSAFTEVGVGLKRKLKFNKKYQHPYLVFDRNLQRNVPAAVNPRTGEPVNNELFNDLIPQRGVKVPPGQGRFSKAENPPSHGSKSSKKPGKKRTVKTKKKA